MFKITQLTRMNVDALNILLTGEESTRVTVTSTTATFDMEPGEALELIATLLQRAAQSEGHGGRDYRSLFAVRRKVAAIAASALPALMGTPDMSARANPVVPWNTLRPVHGHKGYQWHFVSPSSAERVVVRRDSPSHLVVGAVRPDPNPLDPQGRQPSIAYDTNEESVAAGPYPGLLVRWLALRDRVRRLAADRAARAAGAMEMTTEDWLSCVTLAGFPSWSEEFGVTGDLPSSVDGVPTMGDVLLPVDGATVGELLLRELGVDPEPHDPGDLPATVRDWFDEGFSEAWHTALVAAARHHLGTAGPWWTWPAPEPQGEVSEEQWEQMKCRARELGVAQGRADGEDFPIPGARAASRILAHLLHDEPDDELAAMFPTTPLAGQHRGEPTPGSLYRALGVDAGADTDDAELRRAFEESQWYTFVDVVTARCRGLLGRDVRR